MSKRKITMTRSAQDSKIWKKKKCKPKIKHAELRPKSYGIAVPKDVLQENNIKRMNALLIEMLVWLIVKNT